MTWYAAIPFAALAVTFVLKIPIPYGMIAGSILYFLVKGLSLGTVANTMLNNLYTSYIVMSVPLFMFAARIMNSSKVTDQIYSFANSIVGRRRGGLAHVNVVGSLIFAGMTGSAVADASGLGVMEIKAMRDEGYDEGFSCALTAASATLGPIFPPSIPAIMFSLLSGASVARLFIGGMLPAFLLCGSLMTYVALIAKRRGFPVSPKQTWKQFVSSTARAIPALLTPVILLGGIYSGIVTPTEAAAAACLYALILAFLVYRTMGPRELYEAIRDTVKATGTIGLMIAAAFCFSFISTAEHIPDSVAQIILPIAQNKYVFWLIINVVFLILGCLVDTQTILLVFIPMALPVVRALGIDLIHFGNVIILNTMIGMSTPPFGMLLFVVSGLFGTPLKKIIKEILPMVYIMIADLFLITYIPAIVLFLPSLLK
jgi:tripartite ATP-independent transporter DctM subunit